MSSLTSTSSLGAGDIAGIVIGGVLGLATIIGVVVTIYALCCKKNDQVHPPPNQYYPPYGPYGQQMNTGYYPPNPQQQWNKQPNTGDPPPYHSSAYPGNNVQVKS